MTLSEYPFIAEEDYLLLDRNSQGRRYEYFDGELRMLAGGSAYHSAIIANLTIAIGRDLEAKKSSCWIFNSDIRLHLAEARYVYPDITVSCDERDQNPEDTIHFPRLVVEVLSPSTENIDRGRKSIYYQECTTIEEYMFVDSLSMRIEVYHREEDGWRLHTYGPDSIAKIESPGLQFPISTVYRNMRLTGSSSDKNKRMP